MSDCSHAILELLFKYVPECMCLLNKRYNLKYTKHVYSCLNISGSSVQDSEVVQVPVVQGKQNNEIVSNVDEWVQNKNIHSPIFATQKEDLLFGTFYPYMTMVTKLYIQLDMDSGQIIGYKDAVFPSLEELKIVISGRDHPESEEQLLQVAEEILNNVICASGLKTVGLYTSNSAVLSKISQVLYNFPHLTTLRLLHLPDDLHLYKSCKSISSLAVYYADYHNKRSYFPMPYIKSFCAHHVDPDLLDALPIILPNLESFRITDDILFDSSSLKESLQISRKLNTLNFDNLKDSQITLKCFPDELLFIDSQWITNELFSILESQKTKIAFLFLHDELIKVFCIISNYFLPGYGTSKQCRGIYTSYPNANEFFPNKEKLECLERHLRNQKLVPYISEDLLFYLFTKYAPNEMYLLNKKLNLEFVKYKYSALDLYADGVRETLLYGKAYSYTEFVRNITIGITPNDSEESWRNIQFPNVKELIINVTHTDELPTIEDKTRINKIASNLLDMGSQCGKLTMIGIIGIDEYLVSVDLIVQGQYEPGLNFTHSIDKIAQFKYLTELYLFTVPPELHKFESYKTITKMEVNRLSNESVTNKMSPMPFIKDVYILSIFGTEISKLFYLFPNMESLGIHAGIDIPDLNAFELYSQSSSLLKLDLTTDLETISHSMFTPFAFSKLLECNITLATHLDSNISIRDYVPEAYECVNPNCNIDYVFKLFDDWNFVKDNNCLGIISNYDHPAPNDFKMDAIGDFFILTPAVPIGQEIVNLSEF